MKSMPTTGTSCNLNNNFHPANDPYLLKWAAEQQLNICWIADLPVWGASQTALSGCCYRWFNTLNLADLLSVRDKQCPEGQKQQQQQQQDRRSQAASSCSLCYCPTWTLAVVTALKISLYTRKCLIWGRQLRVICSVCWYICSFF